MDCHPVGVTVDAVKVKTGPAVIHEREVGHLRVFSSCTPLSMVSSPEEVPFMPGLALCDRFYSDLIKSLLDMHYRVTVINVSDYREGIRHGIDRTLRTIPTMYGSI